MLDFLRKFERLERDLDKLVAQTAASQADAGTPPDVLDHFQLNEGPQTMFWESTCREILYGGAAGGGKSMAITALPLKHVHLAGFEAVILRRETTQLDDLIQKSEDLVPKVFPGLEPRHKPHFEWTFPSGALVKYRHCQRDHDYKKFDGWEINLLCFDELTHFTEQQYKYICARVRTSDPTLPRLIRATTNPGGPGHEWVFKRWGAWLDPEFEAEGLDPWWDDHGNRLPPAKPGEVWWIRTEKDVETYYRERPPDEEGRPVALSRTFIPASIEDNPYILQDQEYQATLDGLDPVRREQLKYGNWLIKPAKGLYFKRAWVDFVDERPTKDVLLRIRAWDFAGTEKTEKKKSDNPDWTVGTLLAFTKTDVYVEDVVRFRGPPGEVRAMVKSTAGLDGRKVAIFIPQDPGQAGKDQVYSYKTDLRGYYLLSKPVNGDKIQRFGPFSSYADTTVGGGIRVHVVRGPWNREWISELESFPEGDKDDQVDATGDAFTKGMTMLTTRRSSGGLVSVETSDR